MTDRERLLFRVKRIVKRLWEWMKRTSSKLAGWLARFNPGPRTRKGAIAGAFAVVLLLMIYEGVLQLRTGLSFFVDGLIGLIIGAAMIGGIWLAIVLCLFIASKITRWFPAALAAAVIVLGKTVIPSDMMPVGMGILFCAAAIGGAIAVFSDPGFRNAGRGKRIAVPVLAVLSVAGIVTFLVWVGGRGTDDDLTEVADPLYGPVEQIDAPDPSADGPFGVLTLTYGSGEDRRPEFGEDADLITESVDAKHVVDKLSGWKAKVRNRYWGFDRRAFSINGRVWYPDGDGPFPIILCVHGNHSMREYSDPGYAYLGEMLASRGYIFVSVDENFLNGDWSENYSTENDARGWVMLEHLKVWRGWNAEEGHLFHGRVDMDRVALIGHSRGGEAVAVAAAFNRLSRNPDDATVEFDFGFNIRGIVGIAPVDGQYLPSDQRTPLRNINYLLLHGSHDGDVSSFSADRQFKRLVFDDGRYHFKTSIYIYRANHGQFNTVWGDTDWGMPGGYLLNRKEFISGEDQRRIAKVYIGAFMEVVLKEREEYLPFFRDFRTGEHWLPETYYISRFEDSNTRFVADYDEDIDVTTATVAGGTLYGEGLSDWKERDLKYRGNRGDRDNQVVYLGWRPEEEEDGKGEDEDRVEEEDEPEEAEESEEQAVEAVVPASYTLTLPAGLGQQWGLNHDASLVFSLAEPDAEPSKPDTSTTDEEPKKEKKENKERDKAERESGQEQEEQDAAGQQEAEEAEPEKEDEEEKPREPLDFTIEVRDEIGRTAAIVLSDYMRLMPPLEAKFMRYGPMEDNFRSASEATLQTVEIPLSVFVNANARFDPRRIRSIRFLFDRSEEGVIILDELGFRISR